jgi:hypothetical protein
MLSRLQYLVLVITSICYLQGVFEINTHSVKNTWGDEYDTYVMPDQSAPLHMSKLQKSPGDWFTFSASVHNENYTHYTSPDVIFPVQKLCCSPPKLFISFCSLQI